MAGKHPRVTWMIVGVACLAGLAAVGYAQYRHTAGETPDGRSAMVESPAPVPSQRAAKATAAVRTMPVEALSRSCTLRLTGSLAADEKSDVCANTAGLVAEVCADRGSIVKKGDVLVRLDPADAKLALAEGQAAAEELKTKLSLNDATSPFDPNDMPEVKAAKLALEFTETNYKRGKELIENKVISKEVFDQQQTDYLGAVVRHQKEVREARQTYQQYRLMLARVDILRKGLDDTTIRAPFDGWVSDRWVSMGERVIALFPGGCRVVTLLRVDPLRLSLTVPQQHIGQVKAGAKVVFQADAYPGRQFTGAVRYITPAVTADSRAMIVEALVPNPDGTLRPGLFVSAELHLEQQQTDLFVPRSAVREKGDAAAVLVVRGGVVREQIVSVGEAAGERVQVLTGLASNDRVVTNPDQVDDGDQVSP